MSLEKGNEKKCCEKQLVIQGYRWGRYISGVLSTDLLSLGIDSFPSTKFRDFTVAEPTTISPVINEEDRQKNRSAYEYKVVYLL